MPGYVLSGNLDHSSSEFILAMWQACWALVPNSSDSRTGTNCSGVASGSDANSVLQLDMIVFTMNLRVASSLAAKQSHWSTSREAKAGGTVDPSV